MDFETWLSKYHAVANRMSLDFADDNPTYLFECTGSDFDFVSQVNEFAPKRIWTLVECDSGDFIIEGLHQVNRIAHLITRIAHSGGPIDVPFS